MEYKMRFLYDDCRVPSGNIKRIVGEKRFANVIYKRATFKKRLNLVLDMVSFVQQSGVFSVTDEKTVFADSLLTMGDGGCYLHFFSYTVVGNEKDFCLLLEKLTYSKANAVVYGAQGQPLLIFFVNGINYRNYLLQSEQQNFSELAACLDINRLQCDCLYDISDYQSFIHFLSGGFDARYFNQLSGTEFAVTKTSTDKVKIKREYTFYHILPEEMQSWFVLPYHYAETEATASYTMERYGMTDMAIRWAHEAITLDEMNCFLNKAMLFLSSRKSRKVSLEEVTARKNSLYLEKLMQRIEQLKKDKSYSVLAQYMSGGTKYGSIDAVLEEYSSLYQQCASRFSTCMDSVIGHGDFCFSNILFDRETGLMRLIDPKGALTEDELWTDPYYDVAKLSHSICGLYDFFNNGLYSIELGDNLHFELTIDFDNHAYKTLFRRHLQQAGFCYELVRLYEISLFLSMLPLHTDYPKKVFGFLLNAIRIMDEVRECLNN